MCDSYQDDTPDIDTYHFILQFFLMEAYVIRR